MSSTLMAIKAASQARDAAEKHDTDCHKAALVLAREYLRSNGYGKAEAALRADVGPSLDKFDLADNVRKTGAGNDAAAGDVSARRRGSRDAVAATPRVPRGGVAPRAPRGGGRGDAAGAS